MRLPSKNDRIWIEIVTGKKICQLKFLAAKILLGRLTRSVQEDSSPENIMASIEQIYTIYENNINMPSVKDDINVLSR